MRIQATSLVNFARTPTGALKAIVTLPNGFQMETMSWHTAKLVIDNAQTICRCNNAFGRMIVSPGTRQQQVIKI